jgi:hypothetical protein
MTRKPDPYVAALGRRDTLAGRLVMLWRLAGADGRDALRRQFGELASTLNDLDRTDAEIAKLGFGRGALFR